MTNDHNTFFTTVFAIISNPNKELLLVKNVDNQGIERWTLPGGKVEAEETLLEAIHREVFEETALKLGKIKVAYIHEAFFKNRSIYVRSFVFQASIKKKDYKTLILSSKLARSVIDLKWICNSKLEDYISNAQLLKPLRQWLKHQKTVNYFFTEDMKW